MRKLVPLVAGLLALLIQFLSASAAGQESQRQHISGEIKDALGRPVSEATVTLQNDSGGVVGTARSGSNGEFDLSNVLGPSSGRAFCDALATIVTGE